MSMQFLNAVPGSVPVLFAVFLFFLRHDVSAQEKLQPQADQLSQIFLDC